MSIVFTKAKRLIYQNRSRNGGTKLLVRAREIEDSDKIRRLYTTPRGHYLAEILGSDGEPYEVWLYSNGTVHCQCRFFEDLEPYQRQAIGCKHLLAHSLRLLKQAS